MNSTRFWLDHTKPIHVLAFLAILIMANISVYLAVWPGRTEIVSSRKPIIVLGVIPHAPEIELGATYPVTFEFEKIREDCGNGRVVRHMWNIETGDNYLIEDIRTVQSPVGHGKFRAELKTVPLDPIDRDLMRPGTWRIDSLISYTCPTQAGEEATRDEPFSTPPFKVYAPEKKNGGP